MLLLHNFFTLIILLFPDLINTGSDIADQLLSVMLQTSMFISGVLGFFLDNTVPGKPNFTLETGVTFELQLDFNLQGLMKKEV